MTALATLATPTGPVGCLKIGEAFYSASAVAALTGIALPAAVVDIVPVWAALAEAIAAAEALVVASLPPVATLGDAAFLAPLLWPGKVLCAGANYYDHLAEMGMPGATKEGQRLFFFMKPPRQAVVGAGATVRMPLDCEKFDWEIELAAVIGTTARAVPVETALDHVAGYTVALDLSARDKNQAPDQFYKLDWVAGKANDTTCPLGPWIVPASAIPDPQNVGLKLSLNGDVKQDGSSRDMIFSVAEQIAIASRIMTLEPGDVLLTGTPAGVGVPKGAFLARGDTIEATIEGIGTLTVSVRPD
ncbi:fumarylacetoacetate hydrolase family protein [Acuticoccus mangrovi]|uniref:Fumarylacetoacetate hydrolase family protein n=1 Tax=Acuticoccus mangrovi TaxID=2796142 RepID=A0A934MF51_9HYPH|nr:fumarylacetoacetate hydrolase family protein [Acuticoccus mangrovi]MBJ3775093.1 fumarylacetoacetate hydrolase family protein [Acuticoccus mangrovi]